ncbi:MAG: aminomethyl-transferring glycine dehydrogenase subunit GcvPB, partial [Clostridiales bacterium]|nr:aminomethyl-transferring glycine dehydrogenase subunit GcvPB [Clostridiales bacterium]
MKLLFERSVPGRHCALLPDCPCDMEFDLGGMERTVPLHLPELSETDVSRHYTELAGQTRGVNGGFYPLGSCTMKYNPKLNEDAAALPGFTGVHPLQPEHTVQGCLEVLHT